MKAVWKLLAAVALGALSGCGGGGGRDVQQGQLQLREGASLAGAQECGVDLPPCEEGLSCLVLRLEGEERQALCLDESTVCNALECSAGRCAILESYPAQVVCQGMGGGTGSGDAPSSSGP